MNNATLSIVLKLKDEMTGALNTAKSAVSGLGGALSGVASTAAGFAIGGGLQDLPNFFMDSAKAAAEDAASVARLQQAVINSGGSWDQYKGSLADTIKHGQEMAFTDDQTRSALALLTAQTGDVTEAQKRYGMAMDLARGANIDVVTASKLLGKVTDENVNVLGRYGIVVKKGSSETELFGAIQQKFGGQAEAFAGSTAGQMEKAKDQMHELQETLGYAVLPALTAVVAGINKFIPVLASLATAAQPVATAVGMAFEFAERPEVAAGIGAVAAVVLASMIPALIAWATAQWALVAAQIAGAAAFIAANAPLIALALAVGLVVAGIVLLIKHWDDIWPRVQNTAITVWTAIRNFILEAWGAVAGFVQDRLSFIAAIFDIYFAAYALVARAAFDMIRSYIETAINVVRDIITIVMALIHGDWSAAWNGIKQLVSDVWEGIKEQVAIAFGVVRDIAVLGMAALWNAIQSGWAVILTFFYGLSTKILGAIGNLGSLLWDTGVAVIQGLLNGITSMFGAVKSKAADVGAAIKDGIGGFLGINSPATTMIPIGEAVIEGLIVGVDNKRGDLEASLWSVSNSIQNTMTTAVQQANDAAAAAWTTSSSIMQQGAAEAVQQATVDNNTAASTWTGQTPGQAQVFTADQKAWINGVARSKGEAEPYPGYAMGTAFVPRTGLALLHRGEAVIPASQNTGGGASVTNYYYIGTVEHHGDSNAGQVAAGMHL